MRRIRGQKTGSIQAIRGNLPVDRDNIGISGAGDYCTFLMPYCIFIVALVGRYQLSGGRIIFYEALASCFLFRLGSGCSEVVKL